MFSTSKVFLYVMKHVLAYITGWDELFGLYTAFISSLSLELTLSKLSLYGYLFADTIWNKIITFFF